MKILQYKYLTASLILGLFFAACGDTQKKPEKKKTASTPILKKRVDTVHIEPIVQKKDSVKVVEAKEAEKIKIENQLVKEDFYVIGGSFKELKHAQGFEKTLKSKGYKAQVLKPHKGYNRVAIRSFHDEVKARAELKKLRKTFNDVSFWLLLPS